MGAYISDAEKFRILSERAKELRAISEPYEKRATEYHKASVEFSKILLTNIHLINAGGLLATPTIAKFIGYDSLTAANQAAIIVLPPVMFLLGLLFAALSALATYRNFQLHADDELFQRNKDLASAKRHFPLLPNEAPYSSYEDDIAEVNTAKDENISEINKTYKYGLGFGFASIGCFLLGSSVYGAVVFLPSILDWLLGPSPFASGTNLLFTLPMPKSWYEHQAFLLP